MAIQITASLQLSPGEAGTLAQILGCPENDLPTHLSAFASAAVTEYATMFLGQKAYRRGTDILEYRLFLLIKNAFGNRIPDEQRICALFQTTPSESRSLVRSVTSKFQYDLKPAIESSIKAHVANATQREKGGRWTAVINSQNLVEEMNQVLAGIDGGLPPVVRKRGSISTYEIAPSSYSRLCEHLGVEQKAKKD